MLWFGRGVRQRLTLAHDGHFLEHHGRERLVVIVGPYAGDGLDYIKAGGIALAEDGVLVVEVLGGHLGDEELTAVSVGSGVGHSQAAGYVETEIRIELILELIAGISHAGADRVSSLNHEFGNDAMKDGAVVERLVVLP